jgi:hypothetical protein
MEERLDASHGGQQPLLHVDNQKTGPFALDQHGNLTSPFAAAAKDSFANRTQIRASPVLGKAAQLSANT